MRVVLIIFVAMLLVSTGVLAQADVPPIAAVTNNQITIYNNGNAQPLMGGQFINLTWSPDGRHLAFTVYNGVPVLHLSNGAEIRRGVSFMPVAFTSDSSQIVYTIDGEIVVNEVPEMQMPVFAQGLSADSEAIQIGEINVAVGCGGGSPFPMDAIYNEEAGFGGHGLAFIYTDYGIVYSTTCAGVGLSILDLTDGESIALSADAGRATLATDGVRLATIRASGISIFNLMTGMEQRIETQRVPDQIAWGDDNTLYYSVRQLMPNSLPLSEDEALALGTQAGLTADSVPQYAVSIHRVDIGGGETEVYSGPGWAVGRMFRSGGAFYFSLVPNGEAWVEALAQNQDGWAAIKVTLFRLDGPGNAVEVGTDISQAVPKP